MVEKGLRLENRRHGPRNSSSLSWGSESKVSAKRFLRIHDAAQRWPPNLIITRYQHFHGQVLWDKSKPIANYEKALECDKRLSAVTTHLAAIRPCSVYVDSMPGRTSEEKAYIAAIRRQALSANDALGTALGSPARCICVQPPPTRFSHLPALQERIRLNREAEQAYALGLIS